MTNCCDRVNSGLVSLILRPLIISVTPNCACQNDTYLAVHSSRLLLSTLCFLIVKQTSSSDNNVLSSNLYWPVQNAAVEIFVTAWSPVSRSNSRPPSQRKGAREWMCFLSDVHKMDEYSYTVEAMGLYGWQNIFCTHFGTGAEVIFSLLF